MTTKAANPSDAEWAKQIVSTGDTESDHAEADERLCELLLLLGYSKTVEAFRKLKKWYA